MLTDTKYGGLPRGAGGEGLAAMLKAAERPSATGFGAGAGLFTSNGALYGPDADAGLTNLFAPVRKELDDYRGLYGTYMQEADRLSRSYKYDYANMPEYTNLFGKTQDAWAALSPKLANIRQDGYSGWYQPYAKQNGIGSGGPLGDHLRGNSDDQWMSNLAGVQAPLRGENKQKSSGGFGKFLKIAAPIALSFALPGLGSAIGTGLGAAAGSATAAGLGGAVLGAGTSLATGGGFKGALLGGVTGGFGGYAGAGGVGNIGGGIDDALGLGDVFGGSGIFSGGSAATGAPSGGYNFGDLGAGKNVFDIGSLGDWQNAASSAAGTTSGGSMGFFDQLFSGAKDQFNPAGVASRAAKGGLGMLLSKSPDGGYRALQNAAGQNAQLYRDAQTQAQGYYSPFLTTGTAANGVLANALGLNGQAGSDAAMGQFRARPGYQFARQQGVDAITASDAAKGVIRSGNQDKAIADYTTNLADTQFDQWLKELQQQSTAGQSAAGNLANVGFTSAGGVGNANAFGANAEALRKKQKADNYNAFIANALFG